MRPTSAGSYIDASTASNETLTAFDFRPVAEAAALLSIHPDTIRRWIRQGRIPAFGVRRAYRVRLNDLLPPVVIDPVRARTDKAN